jgi:hypothetical protein
MQVSNVGTSAFPDLTPVAGGSPPLTPDMLFTYCETQMNAVDQQAEAYFTNAQKNNQVQADIGQAMDGVRSLQAEMKNGLVDDSEKVDAIRGQLEGLQQECPAEYGQIQDAIDVLMTGNDTKVSSDEAQKVLDTLSGINQDLQSDNQMTMIHLQSAMSAREQVIQLTTNLLQTINDSETKVITNIHS